MTNSKEVRTYLETLNMKPNYSELSKYIKLIIIISESNPKEKDILIELVMNFLTKKSTITNF